jgi:hypothetical protein
MKMSITVSEGMGERSDKMTYDVFRSVIRFGPVLPKQQQASHDAPDRCDDGKEAGELGWGASMVSGINTWNCQECHVGIQQHSAL